MGYPIRILHAVVNMNRGGAETLIMNLYRNIDRSKVQFDFLTCKEGVFDPEIVEMGGKIHQIPYINEVGHFGYIKALDTFFAAHPEYKIIHSHMDKMSGLVLHAAKKAGVSVRIAHSHSTRSEGGFTKRIYKWYAGLFILPSATHLIACSNKAANWLFPYTKNKVDILKNGIEPEKFIFDLNMKKQVREELKIPHESFVIGHVGRFDKPKNHWFLIDIFTQLIKVKPDSYLLLVGDGSLRSDVEKKVSESIITDRVKFLGIRSDIHRMLQAFDVFVFPSLHEGLPVTLIEAQGTGLACIVSDVITNEVDMGAEAVLFQSLKQPSVEWAEKILSVNRRIHNPKEALEAIKKNGYDIRDTSGWLQKFYLST